MPTGHSYIFSCLEYTKTVIFRVTGHTSEPSYASLLVFHAQTLDTAFLSCVPDAHSVSGYPVFPQMQFLFFFPDIFPCISRYSNTITSAWFFSAFFTIAPAIFSSSLYVLGVSALMAIFPRDCRQSRVPSGTSDPAQCAVHPVFSLGWLINFLPQDKVPSARIMVCRTASVLIPQVHTTDDLCSFTGVFVSVTSSV